VDEGVGGNGVIRMEHLYIGNWHNAIRGMRNSWESWDKMDSYYGDFDNATGEQEWYMGAEDLALATRLSKAGSDHGKFLRQILVGVDIIAGNEFFKEYDTYKVGTVANSTSAMHKVGSRFLTMEDFSFDEPYHPDDIHELSCLNVLIRKWWDEGKKVGNPTWRRLQKRLPMGFVYRRTCTLNYQVLKNMYHARKAHRLEEWREFCRWIETLPYAAHLITGKAW
jgi:hypothetical protein